MFARFGLIMVTLFAATVSTAEAQNTVSNYASAQLKSIQRGNSAENFTVSRINSRVINQGIPRVGVVGVNIQSYAPRSVLPSGAAQAGPRQPLIGGGIGGKSKPFSRVDRGPLVSPYTALNNPLSQAEDYYNIVRPLQDQRRTNDAFAKQQYLQQRKLNQIAAQGPYRITGDPNAAPTGHSAGFMQMGSYMNTGGYFAPPTQPKSQR